jgi:hypothetical protein
MRKAEQACPIISRHPCATLCVKPMPIGDSFASAGRLKKEPADAQETVLTWL